MNILLLAPQPFYQDRGTPIAVDLLLRAYSERGDSVDLLTFHEGEDRHYPGVTIHRTPPPPFVHHVPPGLSASKVICDMLLYRRAVSLLRRNSYDLIHAVEEAAFMAVPLGRRYRVPYVYDMDSSIPLQIVEKKPALAWLRPLMQRVERVTMRRAIGVLAVCDALADIARANGAGHVTVLRGISLLEFQPEPSATNGYERPAGARVVFLYVGNLEHYQGMDLMLEAFAQAASRITGAALVVAGGTPPQIAAYQRRAVDLGVTSQVEFIGPQPLARLRALLAMADVLVSPRVKGNNTPMKVYSYLDSERPVLATDLPTHTQVMTVATAMLCAPTPEAMAAAMCELAADPALRKRLAEAARKVARDQFSFATYRQAVDGFYAGIALK